MRIASTVLALLTLLVPSMAPPVGYAAPANCGTERWDVKTLSDPAASQVNFAPAARTISSLLGLNRPAQVSMHTPRLDPVEFTVYRVRARLVKSRREGDHDFHVVIADPSSPSRTMVAEVVDPTCPGAADSGRVTALSAVRHKFISLYGEPDRSSFKPVPGTPIVFIVGVGFWDICTGTHGPGIEGRSPKCLELHPVLNLEPAP